MKMSATCIFYVMGFAIIGKALAQCPSPNGFFPDQLQCDKYISCTNGVATEKLCPDGLVFSVTSPLYERCDFPYRINCKGRNLLQPPQSSPDCPRQNGVFAHADPNACGHFYSCEKGKGILQKCPEGLVFSEPTGGCEWPDAALRCNTEGERSKAARVKITNTQIQDTTDITQNTEVDSNSRVRPLGRHVAPTK